MSKIVVDRMPVHIDECPFFSYEKRDCMAHGGVGVTVCLYCSENGIIKEGSCEWLTEMPKGGE